MEFNKALEHTASLLPPVAVPGSILPYAEQRTAERKVIIVSALHMWNNGENWTHCPRGEQAQKPHGLGRAGSSMGEVWSWNAQPKQAA